MEINIKEEMEKLLSDLNRWNNMKKQCEINIHRLSGAISLLKNLEKDNLKETEEE